MGRNYREDLNIDKNYLDEELIEQPQKFMDYVELAANAAEEKDAATDGLEITKAQVEDLIRSNPEEFNLDAKPREGAIKAAIVKHPRVRKANKRLIAAKRNLRLLEGAKTAFDHRKTMLSKLTDLRIAGFYSEPRVKKSTKEKMEKETSRGIKRSLRSIKRR